ncbi:MAG: bacterial Ig-like domain-containing protein [Prevotella sp.]|nr:bacterial Ig-like domain-containing protein [Prevotella sp.]
MRKQLLNLKFLLMLCMFFCIGGGSVAFAEEVTVNFKTDHSISSSNLSYLEGNVTFNFTKGTNNYPAFNSNDPSLRIYYGAKFTISVPKGCTMSSIQLTYRQDKTTNKVTADVGTYSANEGTTYKTSTWTGDANSVTFSIAGTGGHIRLQTVVVTYSTGSTPTATLTGISVTGTAADLWTGDDFTHEGITVTATYDDGSTADVTNSCEYSGYDMSTTGEQTVTVTYGGQTATYDVTVKTIGNTKETAYTATEAIALIDAGKGLKTPVYVKGIVSNIVTPFSSDYGNITFDVSADGKTEGDQFQFFRNVKGADNEKYTSEDVCPKVGDEVIGYGTLAKYNNTYEFAAGNYLVEKIVSTDPSSELTLSQTTGEVNVDKTLDIHGFVSTAAGYTGTVTYAVTAGSKYASVNAEGAITGLAVGTATIKVTAPADVGLFSETSADFTVTVVENRTATTVTFGAEVDDQTFKVNLGETFEGKTATVSPAEAGNVTYSSDKSEVASVDENGAITIGSKAGTAIITASFAATDTHLASSAKYYITVTDPNGPVFYESFDSNDGTGGNDGKWSGSVASSDIQSDITGWTFTKGYGADQCAKFGSSSARGSAITPEIDLSGDKYLLTFRAGAWSGDATTITVSIDNGSLTYGGNNATSQTITLTDASFSDYSMYISGATSSTKITFSAGKDSKNRFFLDEVKIVPTTAEVPTDVTLHVGDALYSTLYYSDRALVVPENTEAYTYTVTNGQLVESYRYDKNETIPAGVGVVVFALEAGEYTFAVSSQAGDVDEDNMLKGSDEDALTVGGDVYYKLSLNAENEDGTIGFYWGAEDGAAFTNKAHKAYLALTKDAAGAAKSFLLDGTTNGIGNISVQKTMNAPLYNISGQRVGKSYKGMVISNGKKYIQK